MKILFVDDEELIREIMEELLKKAGHKVVTAKDYPSAERTWKEHSGNFDIVITDNNYPGGGGPRLVELIKTGKPDMPVLMITGNDVVLLKEQHPVLADIPVLSKPVRFGKLKIVMEELVKGKQNQPGKEKDQDNEPQRNLSGPCPWAQAHGVPGLKNG